MLHRDDIPGQAGRRPILSVLYRSVSASITGPFRNSRSPAFYQALSDKKALKIHFLFFQSTRPVALKLPFVFHRQPPKIKQLLLLLVPLNSKNYFPEILTHLSVHFVKETSLSV